MNRIALAWLMSLIVACIVLVSCGEKAKEETPSADTGKSTSSVTADNSGSNSTTTAMDTTDGEGDSTASTESTAYMTDASYWETFTYPDGYWETTDDDYWSTYLPEDYWQTYTYNEGDYTTMAGDETVPTMTITNGQGSTMVVTVPVITITNNHGGTIVVPIPPTTVPSETGTTTTTSSQSQWTPTADNATSTTTTTTTTTTATTTTTTTTRRTTTSRQPVTVPSVRGEINVVRDYGVDNTGRTDVTDLLIEIHKKGKQVYYPNGTYLFNGKNLDFSGGVRFESKDGVIIRNSISATPVVNFDKFGNFIGLMHNHLEYIVGEEGVDTIGNLVSPPISTANIETKLDFLPFWYNDFGRYSQLVSTNRNNWKGWYDWRWNHHDCTSVAGIYDEYDPGLHPLLGWYRGDETEVLDWQCYWLLEHGVKQAALTMCSMNSDRSSADYWVYQLMNNVPNAEQMDFAFWMPNHSYGESMDTYRQGWWDAFNQFYFKDNYKDQVYCYEDGGKRYGVIWLWDEQAIRFSLDYHAQASMPNTVALYKEVAQAFKQEGYDGVCILARFGCIPDSRLAELDNADVKWFKIEYGANSNITGATYEERVNSFAEIGYPYEIYGVATGMHTHDPHPSQWNCPGNTPALFGTWVKKAVSATFENPIRPKIVTCYNVSEWSEGGAGLVPTVGAGFGYLEAIYKAIVK